MDQYYRITAVSRLAGVTVRTLRHYDKVGLLKPSQRSIHHYRLYSQQDIRWLQQIITLKYLGLPLRKIQIAVKPRNNQLLSLLEMQFSLLSEKASQLKKSTALLTHLTYYLQKKESVQWETLYRLAHAMQRASQKTDLWQQYYYSDSEYRELENLTKTKTAKEWSSYFNRWNKLFKAVQAHLHIHPESPAGQALGKQWLTLVDEVYRGAPHLRQKAWDAYQAGLVPEHYMPHDRNVIDYIHQSIGALKYAAS